jgi:hypothetical protein
MAKVRSFEARVKALVTSLVKGGAAAVLLANEAMTKFHVDGDIRQLQYLYKALPAQGCPELLKHWSKTFAPITISKDGVWSKDKSKDAVAFNIEGALATSYFDLVKVKKENTDLYVVSDLKDSVAALVKRYNKFVTDGKVDADSINAINLMLASIEGLASRNFDIMPLAVVATAPVDEIRIAA